MKYFETLKGAANSPSSMKYFETLKGTANFIAALKRYGIFIVLLVLIIFFSATSDHFLVALIC